MADDDDHPVFRYPDGKTRGEEARDSMLMLAGGCLTAIAALVIAGLLIWLAL